MPASKAHRLLAATVLALVALVPVGCGGGSEEDPSRPAPSAAEFPSANGRTLSELGEGIPQTGLVVLPAGKEFELGSNRYSFGVFTRGKEQIDDAEVALYFAPGEEGKAIGPFPAAIRSLETPPAYRAQTSTEGSGATTVVYVVPKVDFNKAGEWRAVALVRGPDGLKGTRMPSAVVGQRDAIPDVGEKAPQIHTPTAEEVSDIGQIDTRVPPDRMHEVDFADELGKRPIVLLFSTPAFCETRVCGPVLDIAEQARDETGEEAAFIHMEVYEENDPSKGARSQLTDFGLETEPWLFVIDENGVVDTRIEGAFGAGELREAVSRVTDSSERNDP